MILPGCVFKLDTVAFQYRVEPLRFANAPQSLKDIVSHAASKAGVQPM
jgi:hypothetical protein